MKKERGKNMMDFKNLITLIQTVSDSSLSGFKYEDNGVKISMQAERVQYVTADQRIDAPAAQIVSGNATVSAPSEKDEEKTAVAEGKIVKSPLVGTFYAAPAEGADPFVSVGDSVKKGQTLAIIEAMKLMNDIECEFDGVLAEILVQNGQAVEYGQPLFRIQ